jgi:hypothetical protein
MMVLSFHTSVCKSACPSTCQACPITCPSYLLPFQLPVCMSKGLSGESSYLLFVHFLSLRPATVPICLAYPDTCLLLQLLPVFLSRDMSAFPDTSLPIQISFRLSQLPVCLSRWLFACPSNCCLPVHLFACQLLHLPSRTATCLPLQLPVCMFSYLSASSAAVPGGLSTTCLPVQLPVCLSSYLCACPATCLPVQLPVSLSSYRSVGPAT